MASLNGNRINQTYQGLVKFIDNGNVAASAKELTDGQGNSIGILVSSSGNTTIEGNLDVQGVIDATGANKIAFFYADQASFPSATTYHGAIAHSHADGRMYYAHAGAWVELSNSDDLSSITMDSSGNIDISSNLSVGSDVFHVDVATGKTTISGDLIVDTNTLYVDSTNDRVGIGTDTPASVLHVSDGSVTIPTLSTSHPFLISGPNNSGMSIISSTGNAGQVVFGDEIDADSGRLRYDHSDNSMRFWTNADERMRIDSSGRVGIGTTSPIAKLDIQGDGIFNSTSSTNDLEIRAGLASTTDGTASLTLRPLSSSTGTSYARAEITSVSPSAGDADLILKTTTDSSGPQERMRINSSGNVGIGISSPSAKLHILSANPNIKLQSSGASTTTQIDMLARDVSNVAYMVNIKATDTSLTLASGGNPSNSYVPTERMRIDSSGNFGFNEIPENSNGTWRNFEVGGINIVSRFTGNNDGFFGTGYVFKTDNSEVYKNTEAVSRVFFNNDIIEFQQAPSGTAGTAISWDIPLKIDSSGLVSIKNNSTTTSSPTLRLDANTKPSWDSGDIIGELDFYTSDTSGNAPYSTAFIQSINEINGGTLPSGSLAFGTATYNAVGGAVERMRITSTGSISLSQGTGNSYVGTSAGNLGTSTGSYNSAFGVNSLYSNTSGANNAANGYESLRANTTGVENTANGYQALYSNTTADYNTAIGFAALYLNTTGANNTANGYRALFSNTTGNNNTTFGYKAGYALTTGNNNTIIGNIEGTAGLSDTVIIGAGSTERLRIDSSGNVGIGTTSPDVRLEVVEASPTNGIVADFVNSTNAGGTTAAIKLSNSDSENCDVVLGANRVGANLGSDFFISLSDSVDGSNQERFRITESGNVGIGTNNPNANALLDVSSTTKGVLLPRMTTTQVNAISSPENGLTVYNTTLNTLCFYNGTSWQKVTSANM